VTVTNVLPQHCQYFYEEEPGHVHSRDQQISYRRFSCTPRFLENLLGSDIWSVVLRPRGTTMGGKGGTITRAPNHYGDAETSQQCHKHLLQYTTFVSERPQVRTWGRQTCFLPRAATNLVTPLLRPGPKKALGIIHFGSTIALHFFHGK